MSTAESRSVDGAWDSTWITVDLLRIMKLPTPLRRLWPQEMIPPSVPMTPAPEAEVGPGPGPRQDTDFSDLFLPPKPDGRRTLDILTAWLRGFAGELGTARARMTVVISSGNETVHMEIAISEDTGLTILALHGGAFERFSGYQFLRRIKLQALADITEELSALITSDCAFTLTFMTAHGTSGIEFLLKTDEVWTSPRLERSGGGLSLGPPSPAGDDAIRKVMASTLSKVYLRSSVGQVPL